jgi:transcriptional regulator with XRE-family HTH domain
MLPGMATSETRADRGRRNGRKVVARLVEELVSARKVANLSQQTVAGLLGWSQSDFSRMERMARIDSVSIVQLAQVASLLGLELNAALYAAGDAIRDKGHQALITRFRAVMSAAWQVIAEMPLPGSGDSRSWDLGLRLGAQRVGVEAETAIRDVQRLVRRTRERERDGGMDEVLLVLADTRANRLLLPELLEALGPRFQTSPRLIFRALRQGEPVPGSGVVMV